jgi:hypothetical protein
MIKPEKDLMRLHPFTDQIFTRKMRGKIAV